MTNEYTEFKIVSRTIPAKPTATSQPKLGPLALKVVRRRMVDAGLSRGVVDAEGQPVPEHRVLR